MALGACSQSPLSAIGSISGKQSISETDRVFLIAAGSWDRNRDNVVTCDEWKAYTQELYNAGDTNRDGFIDASEWPQVVGVDRMFQTAGLKYFDLNGDGKVTAEEFANKPNPAFTLLDTAKTCKLDGTQVAGARSKTEFDVSGKKPQSGDPRDAGGQQGQVANGGLGR